EQGQGRGDHRQAPQWADGHGDLEIRPAAHALRQSRALDRRAGLRVSFRAALLALSVAFAPVLRAQDPVPPAPAPPPALPPDDRGQEPAQPQEPAPRAGAAERLAPAPPPAPSSQPPAGAPIVRAIRVEGEQRYSEAQLVGALGQELGKPLDLDLIDRGSRTLWRSFHVRVDAVRYRKLGSASGAEEVELLLTVVEM